MERYYSVFCEDNQIKIFNYGIQKLVRKINGFENIDNNYLDLTIIAFYTTIFNQFKSFHNFPVETKIFNTLIFNDLMSFEDSNFSLNDDDLLKNEVNLEEEYVVEFPRRSKNKSIVSDTKQFINADFGISKYTNDEESIYEFNEIDSDIDLGYLEDDDSE